MTTPLPPKHNNNAINFHLLWDGFGQLDSYLNGKLVKLQDTTDSAMSKHFGEDLNFETAQKVGMVALVVLASIHIGFKRSILSIVAAGSVSILPIPHLVRRFLCTETQPGDVKVGDYIILDCGPVHSESEDQPVVSGRYERVQVTEKTTENGIDYMQYVTADGRSVYYDFNGPVLKEPRWTQAFDALSFVGPDLIDMDDYLAVGAATLMVALAALINTRSFNMLMLGSATQYLLREHAAEGCMSLQKKVVIRTTKEADQGSLSADTLTHHHSPRTPSKNLSPASSFPFYQNPESNDNIDLLTPQLRHRLATIIPDEEGMDATEKGRHIDSLVLELDLNDSLFNLTLIDNQDNPDITVITDAIKREYPAFALPPQKNRKGNDLLTFNLRLNLSDLYPRLMGAFNAGNAANFVENALNFSSQDLPTLVQLSNINLDATDYPSDFANNIRQLNQAVQDQIGTSYATCLPLNPSDKVRIFSCMRAYQTAHNKRTIIDSIRRSRLLQDLSWNNDWDNYLNLGISEQQQYSQDLYDLMTKLGQVEE